MKNRVWTSRLFWKLFLTYAGLNLAATLTFVVIVSGWQEEQVVDQLKRRLHDSTVLIRSDVLDLLPAGRSVPLQEKIRSLGQQIETRITLVGMDGLVLADSQQSDLAQVATMENHRGRHELIQARTSGRGSSERISPTLGEPMLYVAIRADRGGQPEGLIRAALPMTEVRAEVAAVRRLIWLIGGLVSIGVVTLTYLVAVRLAKPVTMLTNAAEAIADGDYRQRFNVRSNDELGALARSFHRMHDQLESRETQLRQSNQRLAAVLEGMAEGVISLDDRQRIVLANAAAGRLLRFSPVESQGRPLLTIVRNHRLHQMLQEAQATQTSQHTEIETGDQEQRVLSIHANLLSEEATARFILVLQDVTELRRLESMRQEFVANVSHELKTPLSSIKAYAETLSQGAINDQGNNLRFVHHIEDQAERLHQLILDLLSLARIESGQQAFEIGAVSVAEAVHTCFAQHQAMADVRNVSLITDTTTADLQVRADEEAVRQILNNLVHNAVNYTSDGGRVTVHWREEGPQVAIDVRDTGIGIAAQHLPRLFERFYRVDKARSRELGGTGLGLSIVKHLTQSFGGSVHVESQPHKGTTFTVRLPLSRSTFTES